MTGEILEVSRDRAVVRLAGRVWLAELDCAVKAGETVTVQVAGFEGGKPVLQLQKGSGPVNASEPARVFILQLMARAGLPPKAEVAQAIYNYLQVPEPLGEVLLNLPKDLQSIIGRYFYTPIPPDQLLDSKQQTTMPTVPDQVQRLGREATVDSRTLEKLPVSLGRMDSGIPWVKEARTILTGLRELSGLQQAQGGGSPAPAVAFLQIPLLVDGEAFTVHLRLSRREEPQGTLHEGKPKERKSHKGFAGGDHLSLTIYMETRWLRALKIDLRFGSSRSLTCAIQVEEKETRQLLAEHYHELLTMVAEAGFSLNSMPKIAVQSVRETPDTPLSMQNLRDFIEISQDSFGKEAHFIDLRL